MQNLAQKLPFIIPYSSHWSIAFSYSRLGHVRTFFARGRGKNHTFHCTRHNSHVMGKLLHALPPSHVCIWFLDCWWMLSCCHHNAPNGRTSNTIYRRFSSHLVLPAQFPECIFLWYLVCQKGILFLHSHSFTPIPRALVATTILTGPSVGTKLSKAFVFKVSGNMVMMEILHQEHCPA